MSENCTETENGVVKKTNEELLEHVRAACMKNKVGGSIMGLSTVFRSIDKDHSKRLSLREFKEGMRIFGIQLTDDEFERLFSHFDADGSDCVDFNEFLKVLKPPMKECRKRIVRYVFHLLDKNGDRILTTEDIAQNEYFVKSAAQHPKYKSKEWKTLDEVYAHFINTFDDKANPNGQVTEDEFMEYYSLVSCAVDRDDAFDLMMCKAFNLDRNKITVKSDEDD